jgi:hypothetical protein
MDFSVWPFKHSARSALEVGPLFGKRKNNDSEFKTLIRFCTVVYMRWNEHCVLFKIHSFKLIINNDIITECIRSAALARDSHRLIPGSSQAYRRQARAGCGSQENIYGCRLSLQSHSMNACRTYVCALQSLGSLLQALQNPYVCS